MMNFQLLNQEKKVNWNWYRAFMILKKVFFFTFSIIRIFIFWINHWYKGVFLGMVWKNLINVEATQPLSHLLLLNYSVNKSFRQAETSNKALTPNHFSRKKNTSKWLLIYGDLQQNFD
jgi:hypothetical protein